MDQSSIYSKSCKVLSWFREKFYRECMRASLAPSWKALPVTLANGLVSLRILNSRLGDIPHFQTHQIKSPYLSPYIYIYIPLLVDGSLFQTHPNQKNWL
jgi:hypothetical protein